MILYHEEGSLRHDDNVIIIVHLCRSDLYGEYCRRRRRRRRV